MCLIVFAWRPGHAVPLILAANRDEFYARPSQPLAHWPEAEGVYAGRDLEAGGTWLGLGPNGRFAALTNIRDPGQPLGRRSRGDLVARFLTSSMTIDDYLDDIASRASEYSGFNLLLGASGRLCYFNQRERHGKDLSTGVYGLSNAGLDTPWPKLLKARGALAEHLHKPQPETLLNLLKNDDRAADAELPDTGVGLATESLLSSVFIASPNYGTRASTALIVGADGSRRIVERSFGPYGGALGEVDLLVGG
ncbi:NRDE family protein [Pseudomonas sp.]|uniref:NRDE family protein n=1 Tax=Pseudomonas sp. TaxID=306 RepID=UPI003CC655FE